MHWGLTTFEKKRIEKIALDHPYFDTHAPLLTKREIASIVKEGSHKNGYQVIAEVMAELGITYVPAKHKKRSFGEALRDMSFVPSFRRSVALGLLCLLLVLFMTFTAPGRAFAEEVYSFVIDLVDGMLSARNTIPTQGHETIDFTAIPVDLKTPQELSCTIDYPIIASQDTLVAFEYESETPEVLTIVSQYHATKPHTYTILQEIYGPNISWGVGIDAQTDSIKVETTSGIVLYLNQSDDGTAYAIGFSETYSLYLFSTDASPEALLPILNEIYILE